MLCKRHAGNVPCMPGWKEIHGIVSNTCLIQLHSLHSGHCYESSSPQQSPVMQTIHMVSLSEGGDGGLSMEISLFSIKPPGGRNATTTQVLHTL